MATPNSIWIDSHGHGRWIYYTARVYRDATCGHGHETVGYNTADAAKAAGKHALSLACGTCCGR